MYRFTLLLSALISSILELELLLLLIRAVMSWVMPERGSKLWQAVYGLTEPVLYPVRQLMNRIPFCQRCPIALSYLVTCLLLDAVLSLLP